MECKADHVALGIHDIGNAAIFSDRRFFAMDPPAILGGASRFDSTVQATEVNQRAVPA